MTVSKSLQYRIYKGKVWIRTGYNEVWKEVERASSFNKLMITQRFGDNKVNFYKQLGMKGHNGIDWRCPKGSSLYSPVDGEVIWTRTGNEEGQTYDNNIIILTDEIDGKRYAVILGHLSDVAVTVGTRVGKGALIGLTGNTGKYTTGAHLHEGYKELFPMEMGLEQWWYNSKWGFKNNGYKGYVNHYSWIDEVRALEFPYKEGMWLQHAKTGAVYVYKNGDLNYLSDKSVMIKNPRTNKLEKHYPLIDACLRLMKDGIEPLSLTGITEEEFNNFNHLIK